MPKQPRRLLRLVLILVLVDVGLGLGRLEKVADHLRES